MEQNGLYGLGTGMENLSLLSDERTRSISAENPDGAKGKGGMATEGTGAGCARDLGQGWKVSPSVHIEGHTTYTMAEIEGPGCIRHIWMTLTVPGRSMILRIYWDDSETPAVECPAGDFFANAYLPAFRQFSSLAVCVNPRNGLNCYWQMPFRKKCRITMENISDARAVLYYQVDYALREVPERCGYFHAQFRRSNPLPYKSVHTILDGIEGQGQYVGTYMAWGVNNNGWWGEGEIKFYMDGDEEFPTICGTGTEDYFCGAYNFDNNHAYEQFCTPYSGMIPYAPDGLYNAQQRFSLYRWHIVDPIRFAHDLRVTMQALGWRSGGRYLPLQDDISSVAYFYLDRPAAALPALPDRDMLEII
ncbi:MAG: glycoside hydrolase family 172 protein [Eubacteriales bacterium]